MTSPASVIAASLTAALPEQPSDGALVHGFAPGRLDRIGQVFRREIAEKRLPGAVVLVAREGEVVLEEAYGFRDRELGEPMRVNDVFRIASMTKPITIATALMLAEEGRLQLPDPVSRYLPEFANLKVAVPAPSGTLSYVDPLQPMTIHDLMRHTSGLTYGLFGTSRVKSMYNEAGVFSLMNSNQEMVRKLSRLPLSYHPGTTFDYGMSTDVLGYILEVVTGQKLGSLLQERWFHPLGMEDTGFTVPGAAGRIAEPQIDPATRMRVPTADPLRVVPWQSGGAGLCSTAGDYLRFAQMLLNEGQLEGRRYLAPSSVRLMASDHLPPGIAFDPFTLPLFGGEAPMPTMGQGFGLGVAIRTQPGINPLPGSVGNYYWGGALGTYFWVDPKEKLVAILMTQAPADRLRFRYLIQQMVYQALML